MKQYLFFEGEIPTLEIDQEGKLRGGFCALGNGSNKECTTPANGQQGLGFSLFNLGSSALF